jgi:hypothetical protein
MAKVTRTGLKEAHLRLGMYGCSSEFDSVVIRHFLKKYPKTFGNDVTEYGQHM